MLARERIDYLLDDGSFHELDMLARHRAEQPTERPYGDGVITGWGTVDGRKVFVFSQDFTVFGGALGEVFAEKIHKLMDLALKVGAPVIGLNDGAGARIQEGVVSPRELRRHLLPQREGVGRDAADLGDHGPVRRRRGLQPGHDRLHLHGRRDLVHVHHRPRRGEAGDRRGGHPAGARRCPRAHAKSGVAQFISADDKAASTTCATCCRSCRRTTSRSRRVEPTDDPSDRLCESSTRSCRRRRTRPTTCATSISAVVDDGDFFEYAPDWAGSIICGFARLGGQSVGIVGNQPTVMAGVLDIESSSKAAQFVRTCDAFNIPLVTFVDVPGFLPGVDQEHGGIIRHGAKLLYAYCEATVPRISVITRKAYGGAYVVMDSKSIGSDLAFAWPSAELAVMGASGAVEIVHRRELTEVEDVAEREATRAELVDEYDENYRNPWEATDRGYVDDVIDPAETRIKLIAGLEMLRSKKEHLPPRKHGNMPL